MVIEMTLTNEFIFFSCFRLLLTFGQAATELQMGVYHKRKLTLHALCFLK